MFQQPELGKKIADYRKEKGMTQVELVEKCNLSVRTLQRIEAGEVTPRTYTVKIIFEALELNYDHPLNSLSESNKSLVRRWFKQFYLHFIDLFNLKTNTMKKLTILTLAFLFILTVSTFAQRSEEESIKKVYESYSKFAFNENGEKAVKLLDSRTISYYDMILENVKNADSLKLESLSLDDKITVLLTRYQTPKEDILKFNGTSYFIYAINNGTVSKNSVDGSLTLGKITVDGKFAKGQIFADGIASSHFAHFYKERGKWRYSLLSNINSGTFLQEISNALGGEKELINTIFSLNTPYQNKDIWLPIK